MNINKTAKILSECNDLNLEICKLFNDDNHTYCPFEILNGEPSIKIVSAPLFIETSCSSTTIKIENPDNINLDYFFYQGKTLESAEELQGCDVTEEDESLVINWDAFPSDTTIFFVFKKHYEPEEA